MWLSLLKCLSAAMVLALGMMVEGSLYATPRPPPATHARVSPADTASVLDGVYTLAQAESGWRIFEFSCMRCHVSDDFTSGQHAITEKFASVGDLLMTVSSRMPADDPGSLSGAEYAAVVSYLLWANGYPAGGTELPPDPDGLPPILIVPRPAATGS